MKLLGTTPTFKPNFYYIVYDMIYINDIDDIYLYKYIYIYIYINDWIFSALLINIYIYIYISEDPCL